MLFIVGNKIIVKKFVSKNRNGGDKRFVLFGNFRYVFHDIGELACKAEGDYNVAKFGFNIGKFLHREIVEFLPTHKIITCNNGRRFDSVSVKCGKNFVRTVTHSVKHNRLSAIFQSFPYRYFVF